MNTGQKLFLIFCFVISLAKAQPLQEIVPPEYIQTVEFRSPESGLNLPFFTLGDAFELHFDDLYGDEADYYYSLVHCDRNWYPSDLTKVEYIKGVDEQRITRHENSLNTLQMYTHYVLKFPNEKTALKLSGNYMLQILDRDFNLIFSRKLVLVEPLLPVEVYVKRSRDMRTISQMQVPQFTISTATYQVDNPTQNIHVQVLQNHQWNSVRAIEKPQFTSGYNLIYRYDNELAFWGGNEYLNFDTKDIRSSSDRIYATQTSDDTYQTFLYPDEARSTDLYTYYPDVNGRFVVRTLQGRNVDIESEYSWVNFTLKDFFEANDKEVHVYGAFNNFLLNDETKMFFDNTTGTYKARLYLKQGFYNYTYVVKNKDASIDKTLLNGSHFQTENIYTVLVYYRRFGDRHDSLIGIGEGNSQYITD
ncbi:MAG: DUF5103 domain-containing protein [Flavobacteriaceae bacterium]|nr:DUF5103 domain-containing protein [Flavobacteriaceae bacterium]